MFERIELIKQNKNPYFIYGFETGANQRIGSHDNIEIDLKL